MNAKNDIIALERNFFQTHTETTLGDAAGRKK